MSQDDTDNPSQNERVHHNESTYTGGIPFHKQMTEEMSFGEAQRLVLNMERARNQQYSDNLPDFVEREIPPADLVWRQLFIKAGFSITDVHSDGNCGYYSLLIGLIQKSIPLPDEYANELISDFDRMILFQKEI